MIDGGWGREGGTSGTSEVCPCWISTSPDCHCRLGCMAAFRPSLSISEHDCRVRLSLAGFGDVEGATLQEAADELVRRALAIALAVRSGDVCPRSSESLIDPAQLAYVWELGLVAASGGDIRSVLFGPDGI